jgi:hypothetical protein
MKNKIKETTELLKNETITKDEADKILLSLFGDSDSCNYISREDIYKQAYIVMSNINGIKVRTNIDEQQYDAMLNSFLRLQGMYNEYLNQKDS